MPNYIKISDQFPFNVPVNVTFPFGKPRDTEPKQGQYGPFYYVTVEIGGEKYGWSIDAPLYDVIESFGIDKGFSYTICREKIGKEAQKWKVQQPDGQWATVGAGTTAVGQAAQQAVAQARQQAQNNPPPPQQAPAPQQQAAPPPPQEQKHLLPHWPLMVTGEIYRQCYVTAKTVLERTLPDACMDGSVKVEDIRALAYCIQGRLGNQYTPAEHLVKAFEQSMMLTQKNINALHRELEGSGANGQEGT